ncbi:MAG TPA: glycosyltransferase family 2 protein [Pseudomonadales bacterium]|nr:glycosyltransferase family 2 protein [Pseudomonadales bacterium]
MYNLDATNPSWEWEVIANEAGRAPGRPAVSVIITLFNYSAYIRNCLESVQASEVDDLPGGFEVIVVDDGSTDCSVSVVEDYMRASALPIRLVKKKKNTGLADARNIGLFTARAPFAFILDADNEIRPECLSAHYQALVTSDCAMAYGIINQFDNDTRKSVATKSSCEWDVPTLLSSPCIDAMAMVRKETVQKLGGYSTEYGTILPQGYEDYDLWLKLAQAGYSGKLIPRVLSDYRTHPSSMVNTTARFNREFAMYFSRKFHVLVQQYGDLPRYFGVSRCDLAIANGQTAWLKPLPPSTPKKFLHRLLGKKMCQSLSRRLSTVYLWLHH